ncbi:MAG TPA: carbohydrate kinase family protein [Burkholderiaceae bacterium]|nr:carbohydrate kinase family protein [Burkholderiaceae bacterium]
MNTLICGSIAYDSIMVFHGRFKDHILPDQVHILNVSFLVPTLRQEFGGVAGNIAYNLALLQAHALPMGTVGDDAGEYLRRFDELGIDRSRVLHIQGTRTAQAFITTDLDDNQIVAFHPGAMSHSHHNRMPADLAVGLALVGPDGREGMLAHADALAERQIPFVFDPGQALPLFSGEELLWFLQRATYLAVNDYEAKLLAAKTGRSVDALSGNLQALIVTRGAQGSEIRARKGQFVIPAAPVAAVVDPTGCGDAYRAGLLFGIANDLGWETSGRLASVMGAVKIEHNGAQRHQPTRLQIEQRFFEAFGYRPW